MIKIDKEMLGKIPDCSTEDVVGYSVYLEIYWPWRVTYQKIHYVRSGKEGTSSKSGLPATEYVCGEHNEKRVWMDVKGKITPE